MAHIERRRQTANSAVVYRVRYRDPEGRERSKTFPTKRAAEAFAATVESDKLRGTYIDPARADVTIGAMCDEWLAGKISLKPTTRALYESVIETHIRPRWGQTPLSRVRHGDIQMWVAELAASHSGGHVRKIAGVLSGALRLAVRDRRIPANPADGLDLPRATHRQRRYLTATEVEKLAEAAAVLPLIRPKRATNQAFAQYRVAVYVLAYCGLRWSELAALRAGRVDLARRRLTIAEAVTELNGARLVWGLPKSYEVRSVPFPQFLAQDLAGLIAGKDPDELVFTSPTGDVLRNRNARRAWFDRAAVAIGRDGLTPHELRHTAASLMVSAGAHVKAVQRALGHASAVMTLDRYADLFDDDLDDVSERLDVVRERAAAYLRPTDPNRDLETGPGDDTGPESRGL